MSHIPWDGSNHCLTQPFSRSLAGSINIEVLYAKRKTLCLSNGEKMHSKTTVDCDYCSNPGERWTPAFNPCLEPGKKRFEPLPPHVGVHLFLETGENLEI